MVLENKKLVIDADDNNFEEIISNTNLPVLIDFWSPTCAPCKMQSPIFEKTAQAYENKAVFVKVNITEAQQVAQNLKIKSIPTIVIFKNLKIMDVRIGFATQKILQRMLDRALGKTLWHRLFGKKD